jgi:hypothetical protein
LFLFGWRFFPHFSGGNDRSPTRHIFWSSISLYTLPQWSIIVLFSGLHVASELFPYRWPQKLKGLKDPFSLFFFSVPKFDLLRPLSGEQFRHALVRVDKFVQWLKIESQKITCKVGGL